MARFGRYQSIDELHSIGFTVVYSARGEENPDEKFAVKAFQPSAVLLEAHQVQTETELFLNSARVQQKVATGDAQHWAPLYQFDSSDDGAFYVTDKYDRSLQQLINGRVRISPQAMHLIIESVAKGLLELKQTSNRPHGNLKAGNVLIADADNISQTKIVLADPLPDQYIDAEVHWNTDLRAIAEFIYQLVMHRPAPTTSGWQAPDSQEWKRLEKQADDWRNLCNRLLNAQAQTMTLESLVDQLAELKPARKRLLSPWMIAAAAGVLVAAVTLFFVFRPGAPPPEQAEWELLCTEYTAWVQAISRDLGLPKGNARANRWRKDANLKRIVEKLKTACYPYKVVSAEGKAGVAEIISHPEYAKQTHTQAALNAIEHVKAFFDPNSDAAWPLITQLNDTTKIVEERHWQRPTEYLGSLLMQVKPGPETKNIAEHVDKLLELDDKGVPQTIRSSLDEITRSQKTVADSADPIFIRFDDRFIEQETALDSGQASEEAVNQLSEKLRATADMAKKLTGFIRDNWQTNVNRDLFSADHGKDEAKTITRDTFTERMELVKQYFYLRPDPRDDLDKYLQGIRNNIKSAQECDPAEGAKLVVRLDKQLQDIDRLRSIPSLEKNRNIVTRATEEFRQKLGAINRVALSLIVDPIQWWDEIKKTSIVTSDVLNRQWQQRRDLALGRHKQSDFENKKNLDVFLPLKKQVELTLNRLEALAKLLPPTVGKEQVAKKWNNQLADLYKNRRRELFGRIVQAVEPSSQVPDPNASEFRNQWSGQVDDLNQWRSKLSQLIPTFNTIEQALNNCYILDEPLPDEATTANTIGKLYDQWKNTKIFEDKDVAAALAEVTSRVEKLVEIDNNSDDKDYLTTAALDLSLRPEAGYAAWKKLGEIPNPRWPNQSRDWENEKKIQARLRTDFETIKGVNQPRGDALLKTVAGGALEREKVFRIANVERYTKLVTNNSRQDKILLSFQKFQPYGTNADLSQITKFETLAANLAQFLTGQQWQDRDNRIEMGLFTAQSPLYRKDETTLTREDFQQWLSRDKGIKRYIKMASDPRQEYRRRDQNLEEKAKDIRKLIIDKVVPAKPDKARMFSTELDSFDSKTAKIFAVPAIEGNRAIITEQMPELANLWQQLNEFEKTVKSVIKPQYCKYLELEDGKLIFTPDVTLHTFEPVAKDDDGKFTPLRIEKWDMFKESANLRATFFEATEGNKLNIGWPKYIRSKKDATVILRFVPSGTGNPGPFYMATHEITNSQYRLFLEKSGAKPQTSPRPPKGWSMFTNSNKKQLIISASFDYPPCPIKWDQPKNAFIVSDSSAGISVTLVTYAGAQSYAGWLDSQLPTAAQHQYASSAGKGTAPPWGDNLSQISGYAHVRAAAWAAAAKEYNAKKDNPIEIAHPPIGAVKDFLENGTLGTNKVLSHDTTYNSPWPAAGAAMPNAFGLYDMIGNVWEWCSSDAAGSQSVICGGSCLSPPQYARPDSTYPFKGRANDVGFRIIVPAR